MLRLFRIGHQSLWVDEVLSWGSADIGRPLTLDRLLENIHGPLYGLILHIWGAVAGDSEAALRFPAAMLGAAAVPAVALVAHRWLGRETAGFAAWLAALSPYLVWYGQEARNYALVVLCACGSGYALLGLRRQLRLGGVLAYLAWAAAGLLANFSFAFLAPLHVAWWLGERGARTRRLLLGAGVALALGVAVVPWWPQIAGTWSIERLGPGNDEPATALRGATTFHPGAVPFALHSFAVGYTLGPSLRELRQGSPLAAVRRHLGEAALVTAVFGSLALFGARALRRRGRLIEGLLWIGAPMLLLSYVAIENVKVFHPRYLAVAAPGFLMLIAAALADLAPRSRVVYGVAIAALWAVALHHHYYDPAYGKEDVRSAAALVRARGVDGERVIAANTEAVLVYYYRGPLPVEGFWLGFAADPERLAQRAEGALANARGVWVVLSRAEDLDPADAFARYIDARHPEAERFRFEGVRVWHLGNPSAGRTEGSGPLRPS